MSKVRSLPAPPDIASKRQWTYTKLVMDTVTPQPDTLVQTALDTPVSSDEHAQPIKHGWKIILPILLMLVVASSALIYYGLNERSEFKALVTKQSPALSRLDATYLSLLTAAKDNATDLKNTEGGASLLKALVQEKYSNKTPSATFLALQHLATQMPSRPSDEARVLGLEDDPIVKGLRQTGVVLQQGQDTVREIDGQNKQIKEKSSSILASVLFPDTVKLTSQTEVLVKENETIFSYLLETNNIGIQLVAISGDLLTSLNSAIFASTDSGFEAGLAESDKHIKDLDETLAKLSAVSLAGLPEYLSSSHTKSVDTIGQARKIFRDLIDALRAGDTNKILSVSQSAQTINTYGAVDQAKLIEFWQSESSRQGILDLRGGWDKVAASL